MVDLQRFRMEGTRLYVSCPKCAAEHAVEGAPMATAAASAMGAALSLGPKVSLVSSPHATNVVTLRTAATEAILAADVVRDPLAVPDGHCPKCLEPREAQGTACPHCGLVFQRFNPATVEAPAWLVGAFHELLGDWGSEAHHEQLCAEANRRGALQHLGRLYRLRLAWFPDDPWAELGREEVVRLAELAVTAGLVETPTHAPAPPSRGRTVAVAVLVAVLVGALALLRQLLRAS